MAGKLICLSIYGSKKKSILNIGLKKVRAQVKELCVYGYTHCGKTE